MHYEIASVAALLRNNIMTQFLKGEGNQSEIWGTRYSIQKLSSCPHISQQILSVTLFEKVPLFQVVTDFSKTNQTQDPCNQLQLFSL